MIHVKVEDENGNSTTVDLDYIVKDPPEVEIKPGQPGEPEKDEDRGRQTRHRHAAAGE